MNHSHCTPSDLIGRSVACRSRPGWQALSGCGSRMRSSVCRSQSPAVTRDQTATSSPAALGSSNSAPAKHPHPFDEADAVGPILCNVLPMVERLFQFFLIDLDPFAAQQREPFACLREVGGARRP